MEGLTGQKHRHVLENEKAYIGVHFDHECLKLNPNHTQWFPLVVACAREQTLHENTTTGSKGLCYGI